VDRETHRYVEKRDILKRTVFIMNDSRNLITHPRADDMRKASFVFWDTTHEWDHMAAEWPFIKSIRNAFLLIHDYNHPDYNGLTDFVDQVIRKEYREIPLRYDPDISESGNRSVHPMNESIVCFKT